MLASIIDQRVVETEEDCLIAILLGIEHRLLPETVITHQLAVDPGLAYP